MILCVISALQTHIFLNILNHVNVSWSLSVLKCINKATVKRKKILNCVRFEYNTQNDFRRLFQ